MTSKARPVSPALSMARSSGFSTRLWRNMLSGLVPIDGTSAESPRCSHEGGASTLTQGCQTSATLATSIRSCSACCTAARHANVCSPSPQVTMDPLEPLSVARRMSWRSLSCEGCRLKPTTRWPKLTCLRLTSFWMPFLSYQAHISSLVPSTMPPRRWRSSSTTLGL